MLTFKQFILGNFLSEGKHSYIGDHKLGPDSEEDYIRQALTHSHAGVAAYGARYYHPEKHPNLASEFDAASKNPDWWVRAEVARNPHISQEHRERLSTDKNSKVRAAIEQNSGQNVTPKKDSAQPKQEKVAAPKQPATPTVKAQKPKEPAENKPKPSASGISVVQGNPEDHGLPNTAKISHVMKNGKRIATAISTVNPAFGELDRDTVSHKAYVGDYTKEDGLKHVGDHGSHKEALIAAAKAHKG